MGMGRHNYGRDPHAAGGTLLARTTVTLWTGLVVPMVPGWYRLDQEGRLGEAPPGSLPEMKDRPRRVLSTPKGSLASARAD